jgi:hypothetical protein
MEKYNYNSLLKNYIHVSNEIFSFNTLFFNIK